MANTELQRTQSGTETNSKKATISVWLKLSEVEGNWHMGVFGSHVSGDYNANGNGQIGFYNGGLYAWFKTQNTTYYKQESTRRFRDTNAWYHVVYRFDTTQSSGDDRIRVYVNGEEITSWAAVNNPPQNENIEINNGGRIIRVGTYNFLDGTPNYFNGSMSHYHFCDGYSYAPTEFGSTDSTTGEWKINTSPSVSYGTNGFLILKDGNTITDQSSNSNNFSAGAGTLTKTEDNPSNVFATLNSLSKGIDQTLSNGNTTMVSGTSVTRTPTQSTLGMSSGKYYAEFKITNSAEPIPGVAYTQSNYSVSSGVGYYPGYTSSAWGYLGSASAIYNNASSVGGTWSSFTSGDIIGIAINLDNLQGGLNKLYFSKNGVWQNGADPSNFTSVTGVVGITTPSSTTDGYYYFSVGDGAGSTTSGIECNFGNGYFGTTAVSSAGTNASGIGIFEYDVPTGFTALSTKGLNL
jgi:hypothetical protein